MEINSVPYAIFSNNSEKFSGRPVADFVLASALPTCGGRVYLTYDGISFTSTIPAVSSIAPFAITAGGASTGQVLKYNGTNWVPSSDLTGASGTVTNVTSANAFLTVTNGTSTPQLTVAKSTAGSDRYLASSDFQPVT